MEEYEINDTVTEIEEVDETESARLMFESRDLGEAIGKLEFDPGPGTERGV